MQFSYICDVSTNLGTTLSKRLLAPRPDKRKLQKASSSLPLESGRAGTAPEGKTEGAALPVIDIHGYLGVAGSALAAAGVDAAAAAAAAADEEKVALRTQSLHRGMWRGSPLKRCRPRRMVQ